jgi:hypothetical protein
LGTKLFSRARKLIVKSAQFENYAKQGLMSMLATNRCGC